MRPERKPHPTTTGHAERDSTLLVQEEELAQDHAESKTEECEDERYGDNANRLQHPHSIEDPHEAKVNIIAVARQLPLV